MTGFVVTGLSMTTFVAGVVFVALWARRRIGGFRPGAIDPSTLQVVARTGLHTNQGLAVVRVGRRHLLVSSGEGGVRMLTELSDDDLAPVADRAEADTAPVGLLFRQQLERFQARGAQVARSMGRLGAGVGMVTLLAASTFFLYSPLAAQQGAGGVGTVPPVEAVGTSLGSVFDALPQVAVQVGDEEGGLRLNGTVGTVVVLGLMALAPTLLLLTTSFTRILVVLHLMRQALGTQNTPPGHLLSGLALLLSAAVMAPTLDEVRYQAVDPWLAGEIDEGVMITRAVQPMRHFMLTHTRDADLNTFLRISQSPPPMGPDDVPNAVLMSAFVTSELRTAFEIGFAIFLPFIVIDLVVAAVLTSMGMFMLPPTMIALPCKLMLFVLMDGWTLLLGTLAESFL